MQEKTSYEVISEIGCEMNGNLLSKGTVFEADPTDQAIVDALANGLIAAQSVKEDAVDAAPVSPYAVEITWAEGHGPENEADQADAKKICDEFYSQDFDETELPLSINAVTIKRING